jgi:hypothetical protein
LNIQSWVQPKDEYENWDRIVANLSREVKHSVLESLNTNYYKTNFIVDLDLRTSGIQINKKSFMNLEVNLFLNNEMDFKSNEIKDSIRMIIRQIYKDCVLKNKYFLFYPTKNSEVEEVMD